MIRSLVLVCVLVSVLACESERRELEEGKNALAYETSPYLLQHAENPVYWYPWGEEALNLALKEDKLVIVSIGYSACHWCHVMERESFEDSLVAATMNEHYVSIKIDREERPDIDYFYVEASKLMTGSAGWPLNIIALPDGSPVFAGTYFPKEQWLKVLNDVHDFYIKNPDRVKNQGKSFVSNYRAIANELRMTEVLEEDVAGLNQMISLWKSGFDSVRGGLKGTQKFPLPGSLSIYMKYAVLSDDPRMIKDVEITLDNMIAGGIYDHLGGGFARYTVDPAWRIPHFEKMLYDNAQLISLYSDAYRYFEKDTYKSAVFKSLDFLERELSSDVEVAFYSSLDADSEEKEGEYYVWTYQELTDLLSETELEGVVRYFNVKEAGNWEDSKNILYIDPALINEAYHNSEIRSAKAKLFTARNKRMRPALDDKKLLSWNSMMVSGLVDAYKAFGDPSLKVRAVALIDYLNNNYFDQKRDLYFHLDDRKVVAFLDDLANYISALIDLYEVTYDQGYLVKAVEVAEYTDENYSQDGTDLFNYSHKDHNDLPLASFPVDDGVEPSANGLMAQNLRRLGTYYYEEQAQFLQRAGKMSEYVNKQLVKYPMYYYTWFDLYASTLFPEYEVAVVGDDYEKISGQLYEYYLPNTLFLGGNSEEGLALLANKRVEGRTLVYVCEQKYCKLPVQSAQEALKLMNN